VLVPKLAVVAVAVLLLNLPFGFWRAGLKPRSPAWLAAIHLPIPFVVALRLLTGLGYQLVTIPVIVAGYFAGQYLGGKLRRRLLGVSRRHDSGRR
jgi:uncharacterized protein involved in cysteine biosynthesis